MLASMFPERPPQPFAMPVPVELLVRREPLAAIREILRISIDDIVNDARSKRVVVDFYRITRRIESEAWLRRRAQEQEARAWVLAHL